MFGQIDCLGGGQRERKKGGEKETGKTIDVIHSYRQGYTLQCQ
jgi:hypothetical protein